MSPEENSYSFLLWPKMITATSTEQRTDSSCAFLNRPPLRLRKVLVDVAISLMCMGQRLGSYIHGTISIILDRFDLNLSAAHHEHSGSCNVSIYIFLQVCLSLFLGSCRPREISLSLIAATLVQNRTMA